MKSRPYPQEFWITYQDDKKRQIPLDANKSFVTTNYMPGGKNINGLRFLKNPKIIAHPNVIVKGSRWALRYVKNIEHNPETGECINTKRSPFDLDKIAEDEKRDGYYAIITSELNMPDHEVVSTTMGSGKLNEVLGLQKHLRSRSVYVSLE